MSRCAHHLWRETLMSHARNRKSRNFCWLWLFFLRVQIPGTRSHTAFSGTFDSKTDSKTGRQRWISVDEGRNLIGLWSGWKTFAILLVTLPPLNSLSCRKRHLLSTKSETKNRRFCGLYPHIIAVSSKRRHKLAASCRWL